AANYGGGSITVLPILETGHLGDSTAFIQHEGSSIDSRRQGGPHAHGIYLDAANRFVFVPDLGLDKVLVYRFDSEKGSLIPNDPPFASVKPGAGPRHFAFHPDGRHAYVINEMQCSITAFSYDQENGVLKESQTLSTLPGKLENGFSTAEIEVHPTGKYLYGSNRGHHSIVVCSINSDTGRLKVVEHESTLGKTPRSFGIDPTGKFLLAANQDSDSIAVFRIDLKTGKLEPTGQTVEVPKPVCVKFLRVH
ncbi:MAG: lactonase family protein, partial [Verrucomicrobia bacterium]|nr:lactonase family protein [Verrucomicrobiota bacterium]